ncbi:hypothetical protein JCM5296_003489 [Sporobolomyces johnsonii]
MPDRRPHRSPSPPAIRRPHRSPSPPPSRIRQRAPTPPDGPPSPASRISRRPRTVHPNSLANLRRGPPSNRRSTPPPSPAASPAPVLPEHARALPSRGDAALMMDMADGAVEGLGDPFGGDDPFGADLGGFEHHDFYGSDHGEDDQTPLEPWELYRSALERAEGIIWSLHESTSLWIVPGYDEVKACITSDFHHLERFASGDYLCSCTPSFPSALSPCLHQLLHQFSPSSFDDANNEPLATTIPLPAVVPFLKGGPHLLAFSSVQQQKLQQQNLQSPFPISTAAPLSSSASQLDTTKHSPSSAPSLASPYPPHSISMTLLGVDAITGATEVLIETIKCPNCSSYRRRIGPDLLALGLINYNNEYGFSRELFDTFLSSFTHSETPFVAFYRTLLDTYTFSTPYRPPPSLKTFIRAFFSFASILRLDSGMSCAACGDSPETVICDGSVIGFASKHLSGKLQPPTMPTTTSVSRPRVRLLPHAALDHGDLGLTVKEMNRLRSGGRGWVLGKDERAPEGLRELVAKARQASGAVGDAFTAFFDWVEGLSAGEERDAALGLFRQVIAPDLIFHLAPPHLFSDLTALASNGIASPALLLGIPVLAALHRFGYAPQTRSLLSIVVHRAAAVLEGYKIKAAVEEPLPAAVQGRVPERQDDWRITGACYGVEKQRDRPVYPGLRGDAGIRRLKGKLVGDRFKDDEECPKYYSQYGAKGGLIGGIAGFWCQHGVCVGFHLMPSSEGRDDFFSGIYCYWPEPPKRVIYDYACALAPYCMTRAPEFFKDVTFLIDEFHAPGHKTCAPAVFVSSHMQADPDLRTVNTSAAEDDTDGQYVRRYVQQHLEPGNVQGVC